jgi:predicted DNA-binding transcriptional regulator AlpA
MNNEVTKFDNLSDHALVRLPVVKSLFGISAPTVWRWSKSGQLPKPIRISGITGWQVGALRKTLKEITMLSSKNSSGSIDVTGAVK